jgi:hypothetical protein
MANILFYSYIKREIKILIVLIINLMNGLNLNNKIKIMIPPNYL